MKFSTAPHSGNVQRFAVATGIGLGAVLLLAGCSSGGSSTPAPSTAPASTRTSTSAASASVTTIPFSLAKNARRDVATDGPCTEAGGLWVLHGMVTNSATVSRTYQIVVDFVSQPGDTVLDTKVVTTPRVSPGSKLQWSATSTSGLTSVGCLIRQVQAPA